MSPTIHPPAMTHVNVRLHPDMLQRVDNGARLRKRTRSEILRRALEIGLARMFPTREDE